MYFPYVEASRITGLLLKQLFLPWVAENALALSVSGFVTVLDEVLKESEEESLHCL